MTETTGILKPEEFIKSEIVKITREEDLKDKLKLFYPDLKYSKDILPKRNGNDRLNIKKIDGLGTYLYFTRKGKTQFHEYLLSIVARRLKDKKIKYKMPQHKNGGNIKIGKFNVLLEVRSDPAKQPENRHNLTEKCLKNPENTIIIVLNKKDKEAYLHSKIRKIIQKNNRFFTMLEFVNKINKITGFINDKQ